ncbi:MAG: lamin tail domain-containing protein [Verrucomicrobiales bacterium]|nr:lamin tail domain-containing protein [Verrucomicrobiales bacterium]
MRTPFGWLVAVCLWAVTFSAPAAEISLIGVEGDWRYFRGTTSPSPGDPTAWTRGGFNDAAWEQGPATFVYGEGGYSGTDLTGMAGSHTTLFLRRKFFVSNPANLTDVELRAVCDDGFVAYLNGVRVASLNAPAGDPGFADTATANIPEPISVTPYSLPDAPARLIAGENVLAVVVLNVNLTSSDLVFAAELTATELTPGPPVVASVQPPPGIVNSLREITVAFNKPVSGVEAQHFLVNGSPATRVSGSGATYTFEFPQPAFGTVAIGWGTLHRIQDLGTPPQRFSISSPGSSWNYEFLDPDGPAITRRLPPFGAELKFLRDVELTFNHAVLGVDAQDLLLNGAPAVSVTGIGAGPYRFHFADPAPAGDSLLSWRNDHGIASAEVIPHAFSGSPWGYTITPGATRPDVVINEIVAENQEGQKDEDEDPEDWIELHNRGTTAANLNGWAIGNTADADEAWVFPAVTLPPNGYLRIWASAKDRTDPGQPLHTDFKLNANGDTLRLYGPELPRALVGEVDYPHQGADHSYGRQGSGPSETWRYFATPTPGADNGVSTITNTVDEVHFSVERGYYDTPFQLTLACPTPSAEIRYTTNGTLPVGNNGFIYTGPILINASRVIRAAATRANHLPSGVRTHTYLYGLNARQRALPALSLVSATNNLYGRTGIMEYNPRNTDKHGPAWERPVSVEYIRPEDNGGFHVNAGLRLQGGGYIRSLYNYRSTSAPEGKYSFRLYFRGEYGEGRLNYPLFPGTTVDSFDTLVLRAGMNDPSNPFIKDEYCRQLSSDLGIPASHGTFVHLFLNGVYKGYYNPAERIDDDFLRTYHGGGDQWDLMASFSELREGDTASWDALMQLAQTTLATNRENYLKYTARLDVTNFVDYLLMPIYADADDWPHNNWRAARERKPGGLWRFYNWDVEWSFGDPNGHSSSFNTISGQLSSTSPPWGGTEIARVFNGLKRSPEFRLLFADRVHRAFFNGGALTDDNLRRRYEEIKSRSRATTVINGFRNTLIAGWINGRRRNVLSHLDRAGFLRSTNAPGFSPFGGTVPSGYALTLTNVSGDIYYTLDGSDPRLPFTDAISPTARRYETPLVIGDPLLLRARTLTDTTNWSALTEARFQVTAGGIPVRISELMYNPPGGDAFEYVELHNTGATPVDLSGFSFEGINLRFATPFPVLPPGARWVLANDTKPSDFAARYPGIPVTASFAGSLSNGGERIALLDRDGRIVDSVTYGDSGTWPAAADGKGYSLELRNLTGDPSAAATWQISASKGGSPGADNAPATRSIIELNEVASALPDGDWIELHNRGTATADLAGWSLTDSPSDPRRHVFPSGSRISAGGYLRVLLSTGDSGTGFSLDDDGETVALFDAGTNVVDSLAYGPQAAGFTVGRLEPSGTWALCDPTPGAANEPAATAPPSSLALNEFLANSDDADDWLELHNPSELPAVVTGSFLTTSNALFQVRAPVFIAPGGFAVLKADGDSGHGHLGFKLPATAGLIALADPQGVPLSQVVYPAQTPGVSFGRIPDGNGDWTPLPFSASRGTSNYLAAPGATLRFSEFMARNLTAVAAPGGSVADWVEIENVSASPVDFSGTVLRLDGFDAWTFPSGSLLSPSERRIVWATSRRLPGNTPNLGLDLPDTGALLELVDARGRLLDRLSYGSQLVDRSAGRTVEGWALMAAPTPATANSLATPLGDTGAVLFNEWLAVNTSDDEWVELINPGSLPVDLGGHFLTDDPSLSGISQFPIVPLSFVPAGGFVRFFADASPRLGPDHLNFRLDQFGETLRLSRPDLSLIDAIHFGVQSPDFSEGRIPDGSPRIRRLANLSPLAPNAPPNLDTDGDGIPDAWELANRLDPDNASDAALDADGDGFSNAAEFAAGTDPWNPASLLGLALDATTDGSVRLHFLAIPGRTYRIQFRNASVGNNDWQLLENTIAGDAPREVEIPDTTPASQRPARFYRVVTP